MITAVLQRFTNSHFSIKGTNQPISHYCNLGTFTAIL